MILPCFCYCYVGSGGGGGGGGGFILLGTDYRGMLDESFTTFSTKVFLSFFLLCVKGRSARKHNSTLLGQ